jgi:hypothetical protein
MQRLMTTRLAVALGALLGVAQLAHAGLTPAWGPARRDLRLGIAQGKTAPQKRTLEVIFAVKNEGRTPVSVLERMSCAGYVGYRLELTLHPVAPLARRAPIVIEIPSVACDKNGPLYRRIEPGRLLVSAVSFSLPASVVAGQYGVLGRVSLQIERQKQPVELSSVPLKVDLRRLAP